MSAAKNPPLSVGIIVDGNRRWAKERALPVKDWHREGAENVKRIIRAAGDRGVAHLFFYIFSTENWHRKKSEVSSLLALLREWLGSDMDEVVREGVRIRFIGERERFPKAIQTSIRLLEERSSGGKKGTAVFCLSYGGRPEILNAVNRAVAAGRSLTERQFEKLLWSVGLPDPDLIIRTGGARRLSNFLTWQSVYSELFFTDTLWPDFSKEEFDDILKEYAERERRFGK